MSLLQERYNKLVSPEIKRAVGSWGSAEKQGDRFNVVSDVVNLILEQAVLERASDIHLEPVKEGLRVRFRVDGILRVSLNADAAFSSLIIRRLKVLAGIQSDAVATQVSQDGRFKQRLGINEYDFRLSLYLTTLGERAVIRVLDNKVQEFELATLGMDDNMLVQLKRMLQMKSGLFLVCGPTGCGKTTTLYSFLKEVNIPSINVVTLEDPIESQIEGMNQSDVKDKSKVPFADSFKAVLRQDPDIILVGEIRDPETAELVLRASISGHLVLSSVYAAGTVGAVVRLLNMGIEPYLLSSALVGGVSQRLVRRICPQCRMIYQPSPQELEIWQQSMMRDVKPVVAGEEGIHYVESEEEFLSASNVSLFKGTGCSNCDSTGYFGHIGLYEVLMLNEEFRAGILKNMPAAELQRIANRSGTQVLSADAMKKAQAGLTTLEEIYPVLMEAS